MTALRLPGWAALACAAAYVAWIASLDALPFQDVVNHLSRAVVIEDLLLDGGRRFGGTFAFEWRFVPYLLGDLVLVALVRAFGPDVAGVLWVAGSVVSLPAAVVVLLRTWDVPARATAAAAILALYLATDEPFTQGFLHFRWAVALVVLAVAAWERLARAPTPAGAAAYVLAVLAGYLLHLSALVFVVAAIGTLSLRRLAARRVPAGRLLALGSVPLALFAVHLALEAGATGGSIHRAPLEKLVRIAVPFTRFGEPLDLALGVAFIALVASLLALAFRRRAWPPAALDALALSAAFFAAYAVLPDMRHHAWGVDIRALAPAWLFLACAATIAAEGDPRLARAGIVGAVALAVANLAVLATSLRPFEAYLVEYRATLRALPAGARVFPLLAPEAGTTANPVRYASCYATIDAGAVNRYVFSRDNLSPTPYFGFREPVRVPLLQAYARGQFGPADWRTIARTSDWLLVERPAEAGRIPLAVVVEARSDAVALARLAPAPAPAETGSARVPGDGP